ESVLGAHRSRQTDLVVARTPDAQADQIPLSERPQHRRGDYVQAGALLINDECDATTLVDAAIFEHLCALSCKCGQQVTVPRWSDLRQVAVQTCRYRFKYLRFVDQFGDCLSRRLCWQRD